MTDLNRIKQEITQIKQENKLISEGQKKEYKDALLKSCETSLCSPAMFYPIQDQIRQEPKISDNTRHQKDGEEAINQDRERDGDGDDQDDDEEEDDDEEDDDEEDEDEEDGQESYSSSSESGETNENDSEDNEEGFGATERNKEQHGPPLPRTLEDIGAEEEQEIRLESKRRLNETKSSLDIGYVYSRGDDGHIRVLKKDQPTILGNITIAQPGSVSARSPSPFPLSPPMNTSPATIPVSTTTTVSCPSISRSEKTQLSLPIPIAPPLLSAQQQSKSPLFLQKKHTKSSLSLDIEISQMVESKERVLDLRDFALSGSDCELLEKRIRDTESLDTLKINTFSIGTRGIKAVSSILTSTPTLRSLVMRSTAFLSSGSHEKEEGISLSGLRSLAFALSIDSPLVILDLSHNQINDSGLKILLSSITNNRRLRSVNLSNNPLSSGSARSLALFFERNQFLRKLRLNGTLFSSEACMTVFEGLRFNFSLESLHIRSKSSFSSKQLSRLCDFVRLSGVISELEITVGRDPLSEKDRKTLDPLLRENLDLRRSRNCLPRLLKTVIGDVVQLNLSRSKTDLNITPQMTPLTELIGIGSHLQQLPNGLNHLKFLQRLLLPLSSLSEIPTSIGDLHNLQAIDLSHNKINFIPDSLRKLKNLSTLKLDHNRIILLPVNLFQLPKLSYLDLSFNKIDEIDSFSGIAPIEELNLESNHLRSISPTIGQLSAVKTLLASNNLLSFLPLELCNCKKLERIELEGNPIGTIPQAIMEDGTRAIMAYLKELERGSEIVSMTRLMIIGPSGSGKSLLLDSLGMPKESTGPSFGFIKFATGKSPIGFSGVDNGTISSSNSGASISSVSATAMSSGSAGENNNLLFSSNSSSNSNSSNSHRRSSINMVGESKVDIKDLNLDGKSFRVWCLNGSNIITFSTFHFFLTPHTIYIITYDISDPNDRTSVDYWIQTLATNASSNCHIVIVGTHVDGSVGREEASQMLSKLCRKYQPRFPNISHAMGVSNKTKRGIKELRQVLIELSQKCGTLQGRLPSTYLLLKKRLELLRISLKKEKNPPIVPWKSFGDIAASLEISSENVLEAAQFLHKSGTIMYYDTDTNLKQYVFLDPQWMVESFSLLVENNRPPLIINGILEHSLIDMIWKPPFYPQAFHPLLLNLLRKFDVCFRIPSATFEQRSIITTLLPAQRPLEINWPHFDDSVLFELRRSFQFSFLQSVFFSKLIQRLSRLPSIEISSVWAKGFIVSQGKNKALLEFNSILFTLKLHIRVNDQLSPFAKLVIDSINSFLNQEYRNQLSQIQLVCLHCIGERSFDPFLFSLTDCELTAARGKHYALCRGIRPVRIDLIAPDVVMADVDHLPIEKIQITQNEPLGEGGFAVVYKGTYEDKDVAIKVIKMQEDGFDGTESDQALRERFADFRHEVSLMNGLYHQNLVELVGLCVNSKSMWMVTEFLPFGNLYSFLHNEKNQSVIDWSLKLKIAFDVAKAMNFLHTTTPCIIHRDLKSPNILMRSENPMDRVVAKVADFGLSSTLVDSISGRDVFNPKWLAPEVMIKGATYTEKADVYSYGIILWELLTLKDPFEEYDFTFESQLEDAIIKDNLRPSIPKSCPKEWKELMEECWSGNQKNRPSFFSILNKLKEIQPFIAPNLRLTDVTGGSDGAITMPKKAITGSTFTQQDLSSSSLQTMNSGIPIHATPLNQRHNGSIKCMATVGKQVWVGCGDGTLSIWSPSVTFPFKTCRCGG